MTSKKGYVQGALDVFMLIGYQSSVTIDAAKFVCQLLGKELDEHPDPEIPNKLILQIQAIEPNVIDYYRDDPMGELEGVEAILQHLAQCGHQNLGDAGSLRLDIQERLKQMQDPPEDEEEEVDRPECET